MAFLPMVVDGHSGAWGPTATAVLKRLAKCRAPAAATELQQAAEAERLRQALSIALHRENARAILRRCAEPVGAHEAVAGAVASSL